MFNQRCGMGFRIRTTSQCLAGLLMSALVAPAELSTESSSQLPNHYALVITGGELLDGTISDSHTPFLTRTLRPLGMHCRQATLVGDDAPALRAALAAATGRSRLVIVTGGLGPTVNDITRDVLSAFTGIPLTEQSEVIHRMAQRFGRSPEDLSPNLRRQARVPVRGDYLPNSNGTSVGLIFADAGSTIIALPGPPRELRPMVQQALVPWLRDRLGLPDEQASLTCRFVGVGQSAIDAVLREQALLSPDIVVASQFEGSRVDFTFSLPAASAAAQRQLQQLAAGLQQHLGSHLYATNGASLESVVLDRLRPGGGSLLILESTGPHLAAALSRAPKAGGMQITSYAATTEEDLRRALGVEPVASSSEPSEAGAMTLGRIARRTSPSAWIIALGQPSLTSASQGTVEMVLGHPDGRWETWELPVRESPETGWTSTVNAALDRLRRFRAAASESR